MNDMKRTHKHLEEIAMNAWPALRQVFYDGWVLRFAKGYTKRANSVNALSKSSLELDEKIEYCERAYTRQELPAIFRITPLSPVELDGILEARGYQLFHPTWVMTLDLDHWQPSRKFLPALQKSPLNEWIGTYGFLSGSPVDKQPAHLEILDAIVLTCFPVSISNRERVVSCGLGVLDGRYFGFFDIVTHPDHRKLGFGSQLMDGMLNLAKSQGATTAYLQVMDENIPARKLYAKLGFQDSYQYWYRVPFDR